MNYLGHAYLSFNHPEIIVGNMVSDFIKGRAVFGFSGKIQQGIRLHRAIDQYTDQHPATAKAKDIFRPHYRLYSAPIIDVLFDHFLANERQAFASDEDLMAFTLKIYDQLEQHNAALPPAFLHMLGYMKKENWLYHYKLQEGILKSLGGLVRRSSFLTESETAGNLFREHYVYLQECFLEFFGDVKQFAKEQFDQMLL